MACFLLTLGVAWSLEFPETGRRSPDRFPYPHARRLAILRAVPSQRKPQPRDDVDDALVDACEQKIRAARACPIARLTTVPLTPRARKLLVEALVRRGLELAGTRIRVAVAEQLTPVVGAEPLPVSGLKRRLVGCTDREIKAALASGVSAGTWHLVSRGKLQAVVIRSEAVLSSADLADLVALAADLAAVAKSVKPKRGAPLVSLWRPDVVALLERRAERLLRPAPRVSPSQGGIVERVLEGLAAAADPQTGLASVPHALRALAEEVPIDAARDALLDLARTGRIELRPESGVELLDPELRALCLPGPRGSLLSYARVLSAAEPR